MHGFRRRSRRFAWTASIVALFAVTSLGAGQPLVAMAQDHETDSEQATVTVSGRGVIEAPPDTAQITLGIDVIRPDLGEAQVEANRQATDIINVIKSAGVSPSDIQTANYSVSVLRNYGYDSDPTQITGFEVMNQVNVTIRDVANTGQLMTAVVEAGANSIYGVTFFVDDQKPFSADARRLAVEDARTKAEQLAAAAGMTVGRVVSISESTDNYNPGPIYGREGAMASTDAMMEVPVETGTSAIVVNVQMTFELE